MEPTKEPHVLQQYTVTEVQKLLGLGRSRVYELIETGELPSIKIGKRRLVPATVLSKFINDRLESAAAYLPTK